VNTLNTRVTREAYWSFFRQSFSLRASSACSSSRAHALTIRPIRLLSSPLLSDGTSVRPIRAARRSGRGQSLGPRLALSARRLVRARPWAPHRTLARLLVTSLGSHLTLESCACAAKHSQGWLLGAHNVERLNVRNRATGITANRESEGGRIGLSRLDLPYEVNRRAALAAAAVNGDGDVRGSLRHGALWLTIAPARFPGPRPSGRKQSSRNSRFAGLPAGRCRVTCCEKRADVQDWRPLR